MGSKNNDRSAVTFLKAFYQHCEQGFINIRFLPSVKNLFIPLSKIDSIPAILEAHKGQNAYFGVATRVDGDGSKDGIIQIPTLYVDIDMECLAEEKKNEIRQRYQDFPLKPSLLVNSGGGIHTYWLLKVPASKEEIPLVENFNKRLSSYFGGDKASTDASRILRIPKTLNYKYSPPREVTVMVFKPQKEYNLSDFDFLPEVKDIPNGEEKHLTPGWEKELLEGVSEGERNNAVTKLAGRYIGKRLSREEILPILLDANSKFKPPLDVQEVEACLDSIIKTHERNHPDDTPGLSEKRLFLPTLSDIYDLNIKVEWIVEKLIPKQAVTVLYGRGGIGKTWLMLQLGSCVAEGTSFCGLATLRTPCYYTDFENSLATLHDRAVVLGKSSLLVWHISNSVPPPRLDSNEWTRYKELMPGFLIFDTLRASQLLDENSSKDMTTIMMRLKELRDMGFTIVLIHHTPKSDERTYKGSTAIQDQCDHVLSLDRVKNVGSEQEVEGDEEDWDYPLRLGVRGKTRYEPFSLYLQFDPSKGFEVAPDPDDEALKNIHSLLVGFKAKEGISPNQTQIITLAKDQGTNRKRLLRLLRKGEGRFWNPLSNPKTRAILYDPISIIPLFPTIYTGDNGTTEPKTGSVVSSSNQTMISEPVENTLFTHCPDSLKNKGTSEVNLLEGEI